MIELRQCTYQYPNQDKPVFENIDFAARPGETILLEGANGSGKTTLLKILAGIIPQFSGGKLEGTRLLNNQPHEIINSEQVGMVFHGFDQQFIQSRVDQEIVFILENLNFTSDEIHLKLNEVVSDFKLESILHREIHSLSSGERQLLKLALAFVNGAKIILMDEPLAYVDAERKKEILDLLVELQKQKKLTYVIADHDLTMWECFSDNLKKIRMSDQNLVVDGFESVESVKGPEIWLHLDNVSFSYTQKKIIHNLKKSIRAHEKIVISGPNGSGKTTLLNLLMGSLTPTSGSIVSDKLLNAKLLSNSSYDYFFSMKMKDEFALEKIEINPVPFDVREWRDRYVFDLSQGERKKVALNLVLGSNADILFLDEPLAHLDGESRMIFIKALNRWCASGKTVVMTAHDSVPYQSWASQIWDLR